MAVKTLPGPTIDEATKRPRIKGEPQETVGDKLRKGVKPDIIGEPLLLECHTCGYGGVRDPWYGFFAIPRTNRNEKRAADGGDIQCPHCSHSDCTAIKNEEEMLKMMTREESEAKAKMLAQENEELRRQNTSLREREKKTRPEKSENSK